MGRPGECIFILALSAGFVEDDMENGILVLAAKVKCDQIVRKMPL